MLFEKPDTRWVVANPDNTSASALVRDLNISPTLARMLTLRGIVTSEVAYAFLHPSVEHLHDPLLMLGMDVALQRIFQAIDRKEKILIYGDYDVDGSLAVVVLRIALSMAGADVECYIPHRINDGYGMREAVIEQAREKGIALIVSVDTGIRAFPVVERARQLGIDCIITDHHLPEGFAPSDANGIASNTGVAAESIPNAHAVLNPKQSACRYPDKNLCGVGVAFKLAHAILAAHPSYSGRIRQLLPSFLKLVSIGTIADSVPLFGENRVIASLGLVGLRNPVNSGLKALIDVAGLNGKPITATDVGFRLAPRLNAAGRMESAQDVIDLFTTTDAEESQRIALKLNFLNSERQRAEQDILEDLDKRATSNPEEFSHAVLVLDGEKWHRGVIGIVASRMMDRYHRPALVISREDGSGHGSGRSFESFPLLEALTSCSDLFERFGGHACAAGFVVPEAAIPELRTRLNAYALTRMGTSVPVRDVPIDEIIFLGDISLSFVEEIELLGPYGVGNPRPTFAVREARLNSVPRVLKEKHLKMQISQQGRTLDAIGWRKAEWIDRVGTPGSQLDLAFHVSLNHFRDSVTPQLEIVDMPRVPNL